MVPKKTVSPEVKEFLSRIGRKGGAAGKGECKRRGDSEYYRQQWLAVKQKRESASPKKI
jgi:hypothetical protein